MSEVKSLDFEVQVGDGKSQKCTAYFPNIGEFFLPSRLPSDVESLLARTICSRLSVVRWEKKVFPLTFLGNPWLEKEQSPVLMAVSPLDENYEFMRMKVQLAMSRPAVTHYSTIYVRMDLLTLMRLMEWVGYFDDEF